MSEEIMVNGNNLPQINSTEDMFIYLLTNQKKQREEAEQLNNRVTFLESTQPVMPSVTMELERQRKKRVIQCLGGKESEAYKQISRKVFSEAGHDFKTMFRIPRYDMLQRKDEKAALAYWDNWEPCTNTKMEIKQLNNQMRLQIMGE